jgi:hypothetical protein
VPSISQTEEACNLFDFLLLFCCAHSQEFQILSGLRLSIVSKLTLKKTCKVFNSKLKGEEMKKKKKRKKKEMKRCKAVDLPIFQCIMTILLPEQESRTFFFDSCMIN